MWRIDEQNSPILGIAAPAADRAVRKYPLPFNKLLSFGVSRADYAGTCNCHLGSSKDLDLWVGF